MPMQMLAIQVVQVELLSLSHPALRAHRVALSVTTLLYAQVVCQPTIFI
jgi:hypothetical protein